MERFEHFDQQPYDATWRKELPAFLTLCPGEFSQEVFIDSSEGVVAQVRRNFLIPSSGVPLARCC